MKFVLVVLVVLLLGWSTVGCSTKDNGGTVGGPIVQEHLTPPGQLHANLPAAIAASGQLRVGAALDRPPLMFYATGTTTPEGVEADLLQSITRQLGVRVTLVNLPLVQLGPALLHHQIDAIAGGFVDIKPFEGAGINFVDDLTGHSAVLVRQGNPNKVGGPNDLCGRTVALVAGTAQQSAALQLSGICPEGKPIAFRNEANHAAVIDDVISGRAQAAFDDSVVADYAAQASTGAATLMVVGSAVSPLPYGIGVVNTDSELLNVIQAALLAVIRDGEYDAALARWGAEAAALRTAPINAT
jgi:polar amino acid transport system substrate-binding protein